MFRTSNAGARGEVTRHPLKAGQHTRSGPSEQYPFRLNFYIRPPLDEVTIEEFEGWALDRLRSAYWLPQISCCHPLKLTCARAVLADIEALLTRGRPPDDVAKVLAPRLKQYLPLSSNTAVNVDLDKERRKDHIGHFVLRLAFCRT